MPGIVVPEHVQERYRKAGPDAAAEGLAIARDLVAACRDRVAGVQLIPPFKAPLAALDVLVG